MSANVMKNNVHGTSTACKANHINVATMAPIVPGPHGQKPAPNPVPIIVGNSGNFLIVAAKVLKLFEIKYVQIIKKHKNKENFLYRCRFSATIVYLCTPN